MQSAFIIVDETSMMGRSLFERAGVALKYLVCHSTNGSKPGFGEICMLFTGDYVQQISGFPFREWVDYEIVTGPTTKFISWIRSIGLEINASI